MASIPRSMAARKGGRCRACISSHVGVDGGQAQVRVERRVPLAREVLGAGRQPPAHHARDAGRAVAGHDGRVLPVRADADVGAVAVGEDVETGPQVEIDAEPAQLARLDQSLPMGEGLRTGHADGEIVGKDRGAPAKHDHPAPLVIGGHEQPPAERGFEATEQVQELRGALEVAAIEDEAAGARLPEQANVGLGEGRPAQADHQPLADEILEVRHARDPSGSNSYTDGGTPASVSPEPREESSRRRKFVPGYRLARGSDAAQERVKSRFPVPSAAGTGAAIQERH